MNTKITKGIVEQVKKYESKFPNMTRHELGKLVGVSAASVSNISNGMYNYMLEEASEDTSDVTTVKSVIPYEEYKNLVKCEMAIQDLFNAARASMNDEGVLFVDFRCVNDILLEYFPEEHKQRVIELEGERYDG